MMNFDDTLKRVAIRISPQIDKEREENDKIRTMRKKILLY